MRENFFRLSCMSLAAIIAGSIISLSQIASAAAILEGQRMHPVQGTEGMVVTSHFLVPLCRQLRSFLPTKRQMSITSNDSCRKNA